ncbi:alpha/beta fold hydrolase [Lacrimispora sp. JR3]|uniref:alpha/beta fold hydrolase n=1 Tax=Lacrimispora sinapis TaxID=3111456 RepID=UPI003749A7D5
MGYYVTVDGDVKIYVEDLNPECKDTILFLHGWPGSHRLFEYQFDVLPGMGFRCIGIDTRGFGDSDKPFYGYDYDRLADDVRQVIEALGLDHITLAGHSTGGAIAIRYMARHHEYGVSRLALFAAAAPSLIKRPNFPYGIEEQTVLDIIDGTYADRPNMLNGFGNRFFFQHITEPFAQWFFQIGIQAAGWATAAIAKTWVREVLFQDLAEITVPTLIIHGIHDEVVPFVLGQIQHQYIKNSVLEAFEFSGHAAFYDQKDEFNKKLADFAKGEGVSFDPFV